MSSGLTFLQAAPLLGDTAEAQRCRDMGRALIMAVADLPHKLDERQFVKQAAYCNCRVLENSSTIRCSHPSTVRVF